MLSRLFIFAALFICYYIFSGRDGYFFIATGLLSSFLALELAIRMDVVKGFPVKLRIIYYWIWLFKEVVLSTLVVLKHIWFPWNNPKPSIVEVNSKQRTEMGYTIYGNSITLTPGTVCVYINDDENTIIAHCLTEETKKDLLNGKMDGKIVEVIK